MKDTENRPQPRKRRKWGSVIVRRDADGNPTSFQARYVNPLDPPKKVGRNFGLELFCFNVCSTGSAVFFRSVG